MSETSIDFQQFLDSEFKAALKSDKNLKIKGFSKILCGLNLLIYFSLYLYSNFMGLGSCFSLANEDESEDNLSLSRFIKLKINLSFYLVIMIYAMNRLLGNSMPRAIAISNMIALNFLFYILSLVCYQCANSKLFEIQMAIIGFVFIINFSITYLYYFSVQISLSAFIIILSISLTITKNNISSTPKYNSYNYHILQVLCYTTLLLIQIFLKKVATKYQKEIFFLKNELKKAISTINIVNIGLFTLNSLNSVYDYNSAILNFANDDQAIRENIIFDDSIVKNPLARKSSGSTEDFQSKSISGVFSFYSETRQSENNFKIENIKVNLFAKNILSHIEELNEDLPRDLKAFYQGLEKTNNLKVLTQIYNRLSNWEVKESFTKLGISRFKSYNSYKFYEVSFKVSKCNSTSSKVEFLVFDISNVVNSCFDKTEKNYKMMVLNKIGNELKNPLDTMFLVLKNIRRPSTKKFTSDESLNNSIDAKEKGESFNSAEIPHTLSSLTILNEYLAFVVSNLNSIIKLNRKDIKDEVEDKQVDIKVSNESEAGVSHINELGAEKTVYVMEVLNSCYEYYKLKLKYDYNKFGVKLIKDFGKFALPVLKEFSMVKFKLIIMNLLSNAIKYTGFGEVKITANTYFEESKNANILRIMISDTGVGLTSEEINTIYEKGADDSFFNPENKRKNITGYGLILVNEYLKSFNSVLKIKSEVNKGSVFYFEIEYKEIHVNVESIEEVSSDKKLISDKFISNDDIIPEQPQDQASTNCFVISDKLKSMMKEVNIIIEDSSDDSEDKKLNAVRVASSPMISSSKKNKTQALKNILLCEGEFFISNHIEKLLYKCSRKMKIGIKVKIVPNGVECLHTIYREYLEGKKYCLLLIDDKPSNMQENYCIKYIKSLMNTKQINNFPIYSTSGYYDKDYQNELKSYGCDGFLTKPISEFGLETLLKTLKV